jgi:uncharacterized protein DUF4118
MTMRRSAAFNPPVKAYGFALIVTACAVAAGLLFRSFFAANSFAPLYLAAAIAAWYGGLGAGLVSVLGSAIAADYFFLPLHAGFGFNGFDATGTLPQALLFVAVAGVITGLIAAAHRRRGEPPRPAPSLPLARVGGGRGEQSLAERGLPLLLLNLRTHLTVATLAAAQLRRRHVSTIEAARLCVYVIRAHAQMLDDIKALEAELGENDQTRDPPR